MGKPYFRERDGMWVVQFELPPRPDGQRRRKYVTAKSRAAVIRKAREMRVEIDRMGDILTNAPTVEKWLDYWIDNIAAPTIRPRTLENYRHMITLIKPAIGKTRLDKITAAHVRRVHIYVQETRGLSPTTARNAHAVLRKALNDARIEGAMRGDNPAEIIKAPGKAHYDVLMLTADQAVTLLRSVAADPRAAIRWSLALMMGMRQGECLGLMAGMVDLEAGTIRIEWQVQELDEPPRKGSKHRALGGKLYLTDVKTSAGEREVPMPDELLEMMRRYLPTLGPTDFICGNTTPSADEKAWKRALKAAGLPAVKLHSARHSTMTLLAKLGVGDHVRQRIAGHASAQVTRAVYTHADDADTRDAMGRLGKVLAISPRT